MLHAGMIVFLITSGIPSCGDGQIGSGADSGEFREVGIYVKQPTQSLTEPRESQEEDSEQPESPNAANAAAPTANVADALASEMIDVPALPQRAVIGESRGTPSTGGVPAPSEALVTPNAIRAPESAGQGPGTVSFMGKTTEATTIVYVIDTSSSMNAHDAIEYARLKLKQSINGLGQKQKFQIIAYNLVPSVMKLRNDRSKTPPLYQATGPNLTLATQYINTLTATSGTKHLPALREAFRYKPDVMFFLTDAEDGLTPRELDQIKREWNNTGKTHIHCIQFAEGPDLGTPASVFLKKLAGDNRGSYTYINTTKLDGY